MSALSRVKTPPRKSSSQCRARCRARAKQAVRSRRGDERVRGLRQKVERGQAHIDKGPLVIVLEILQVRKDRRAGSATGPWQRQTLGRTTNEPCSRQHRGLLQGEDERDARESVMSATPPLSY